MARLSELTDSYYDPMAAAAPALPVEQPFANNLKKVYITGSEPDPELPVIFSEAPPDLTKSTPLSNNVDKILNALFRDDEKRLQLWPEKLLRAGATAAGDVASGKVPLWSIDNETGDVHTSPQMIEKAQEISALAGTGGLANPSKGATLNATPSLRPALKHNEKLYKGKPGQEHQDIIPDSLYNDFQKKAMRGDDLAEYNFGFVNDKGHFLSREDALKYGIDNGLIDPQAGKYGALTSTLMADSSKPGTAIEAVAKSAQPFFSAVEHNVAAIPQTKMNGEAWLGTLSNKPGVKPEELQWTGLADFLAENKGKPVTKAQIEEHLAANKVELKEISKGGEAGTKEAAFNLAKEHGWKSWDEIDPATQAKYIQRASKEAGENPTKYHNYQLPGGENYREMLLTLPSKQERSYGFEWFDPATQKSRAYATEAEAKANAPAGAVVSKAEIGPTKNPDYRSSHWDEPNILAHVRMNDRTVDGKKSLHLEEIQSDWHQQGRDKGYSPKENINDLLKQEKEVVEKAWLKESGGKYKNYSEAMAASENGENFLKMQNAVARHPELEPIRAKMDAVRKGVPDAPFKKTWHELALKRMIREASEKGYDRLSWTPGEAQAARYDLSKQVDNVKIWPDGNGKYYYEVKKGNRDLGLDGGQAVPADKLKDIVGKELTEKALKDIEGGKPANYSGLDLKIGGEGMKGFYDQIIPKALEKLGKEHGIKVKQYGVTPEEAAKNLKDFETSLKSKPMTAEQKIEWNKLRDAVGDAKNGKLYYIDIPQSLRDTATQKGFPLFSKGGYMLQPVDYEPEFRK